MHVEVHKDHFNSDADDATWIAEVGKRGWAILTKDAKIRSRQVEIIALMKSGQPAFVLTSGNTSAEENAVAILIALPDILECIRRHRPPFVAQITKSGKLSIIATHSMMIKHLP